jgi:acetyl-CoA/propionyl-CoA carboxylase biotin carboxyl carrier protein
MFARVLVANRGEIAVRVMRTLRRMGIESVAVYSDADVDAPHVRAADGAVRLGPAPAAESYLDVARVIDAAVRSGADAIHPGYGFLSERPALPRACAAAGIAFVGPGAEAMALLGDKVAAKAAAQAAGVPIVPGLHDVGLTDEAIVEFARGQDLPLLLKAAAGGGGKGMRIVRAPGELEEALGAARREARAAFGDDALLVERYLEHARHIEVQVIADAHGTVLHLGERECSLQRRHQKVVEEAPSPVVGPALRAAMGDAAVALARSAGYVNAGTVELICERDDPSRFHFLEMNARLQVEHPVTEAVTGLDLVELQLRVAAGERLGLQQEDVVLRGHAVEARVYAEDPAAGFLPSTGRVVAYREPEGTVHGAGAGGGGWAGVRAAGGRAAGGGAAGAAGAGGGVRVDSGIAQGSEVTAHYDPMLAKVIAFAPDRATALVRLDRALAGMLVVGPTTNIAYVRALIARPEVREGALDTALIERLGDAIAPPPPAEDLPALAVSALIGEPRTDDPWDAHDGWRLGGPAASEPARMRLRAPDGALIDATAPPSGGRVADSTPPRRSIRHTPPGGGVREVEVVEDGDAVWLVDGGVPTRWAPAADVASEQVGGGSLEAPMPGVVLDVRAVAGAQVSEGDVLVVLESMKMELTVVAPADGVVGEVHVAAGEHVARGQALVEVGARATETATATATEAEVTA